MSVSPLGGPPPLRVADLAKRYDRRWALDGASFTVGAGEIVGLIGPNGSGKTTLMETVAGLLPADRGRVEAFGKPVDVHDRKQFLFYVPDSIRPWPDQPVGWILRMAAGLLGGRDSVEWNPTTIARRLALDHLIAENAGTLSKGEHRRMMLAIGLVSTHPVLLLDEPFDGLDLRQTHEVMAVLRECAASGRSLLLSIHQLTDAGRVADRLVLLSAGTVVGEGTLDELRAIVNAPDASVEEVFLALT